MIQFLAAASQQQSVPASSWDYEGVMTVGNFFNFAFGYSNGANGGTYGAMTPSPVNVGVEVCGVISYFNMQIVFNNNSNVLMSSITEAEIDGVVYAVSGGIINVSTNPFPVAGATHTIKIKI